MTDIIGNAIFDYHQEKSPRKLWIHNRYGRKEEMPVDLYFRDESNMTAMELMALDNCKGKILDIGAGAGSHALVLQQRGFDVTALELSVKAAEVIKLRGVSKVVQQDIFDFTGQQFDTLLLMMNGVGLTGTVNNLRKFLQKVKTLLTTKGQLLFDSSDVAYLYNGEIPKPDHYYGEIDYCYEYKRQKGEWFKWLYIDRNLLTEIAKQEGWKTEVLAEDEYGQYLVKLVRNKRSPAE